MHDKTGIIGDFIMHSCFRQVQLVKHAWRRKSLGTRLYIYNINVLYMYIHVYVQPCMCPCHDDLHCVC